MLNIKDYKLYLKNNKKFLQMLSDKQSIVFDRLDDLFKVLDHIAKLIGKKKPLEEGMDLIFEVGFSYLHEQIEEIKLYYNFYFNDDYEKFKEHEVLINYSLYLDDLEDVLKEKDTYDAETQEVFDLIKEEIDELLANNKKLPPKILQRFNQYVEELVPVGTLTTLEIYAMIVEELQI